VGHLPAQPSQVPGLDPDNHVNLMGSGNQSESDKFWEGRGLEFSDNRYRNYVPMCS